MQPSLVPLLLRCTLRSLNVAASEAGAPARVGVHRQTPVRRCAFACLPVGTQTRMLAAMSTESRSARRLACSRRWLLSLSAAALLACSVSPRQPGAVEVALLAAEAGRYREVLAGEGTRYSIDAAASEVLIYVFRGGRAAQLGHNHVLSAPQLEGMILVPEAEPTRTQLSLRLRLDQLVIDEPRLRQRTGGNFAGPRSTGDIEGTRRNLLKTLGADQHPQLVINSLAIAGDWPRFVADLAVTLRGVTRLERIPLHVMRNQDGLQVHGALAVRQSDYGVTPYSLLGGTLAVQDAVAIEFSLRAKAEPAR